MSLNFRKALLIEDELSLKNTLSAALDRLEVPFEAAENAKRARELFFDDPQSYDLIFLDRILPDGEGLELCREFRRHGSEAVIIVLSALGSVQDRVQGLETGADDYLAKPFSLEELTAKLYAYSRRRTPTTEEINQTWGLNEAEFKILGPQGWVQLTKLEYRLASYLIRREKSVVSREELLKNVWGFQLLPKTRTADLFMSRLRKYFETDPENPKHFLTIRGVGYRFEKG
jgi:two-component system, OmpR family, alkaline phosphatase synthesis response regulator PhoP